jgi:tRNA(Ile)-lysidine synthase
MSSPLARRSLTPPADGGSACRFHERAVREERAPGPSHALFDAEALPPELSVRAPQAGDRVRLLAGGTRKLQDVLVDAKVPREARIHVPLLLAGDSIVWVAGLARGRGADLVATTRQVVEATLVRTS